MTATDHQSQVAEDLAFAKKMALAGQTSPLVSGRFFLLWGGLACLALPAHWTVLQGMWGDRGYLIGFIWLVFGVVGGVASIPLGRTVKGVPGVNSAGNRATEAVWTTSAIVITVFAIALTVRTVVEARGSHGANVSVADFDMIWAVVFACYAISFFVSARIALIRWMYATSAGSIVAVAVITALAGYQHLPLIVLGFTGVLVMAPGLALVRNEPQAPSDDEA